MEPNSSLDPTFWYVFNHRYNHLVYRNKDRAKAKAYASSRNNTRDEILEYIVVSGSQLQIQGVDEALRNAQYS